MVARQSWAMAFASTESGGVVSLSGACWSRSSISSSSGPGGGVGIARYVFSAPCAKLLISGY